MDCLLHNTDFSFLNMTNLYEAMSYLVGESRHGAECDCYPCHFISSITYSVACQQNPHLSLYLYTEGTSSDLSSLELLHGQSLEYISKEKAGYVKPCGCFEFIPLS